MPVRTDNNGRVVDRTEIITYEGGSRPASPDQDPEFQQYLREQIRCYEHARQILQPENSEQPPTGRSGRSGQSGHRRSRRQQDATARPVMEYEYVSINGSQPAVRSAGFGFADEPNREVVVASGSGYRAARSHAAHESQDDGHAAAAADSQSQTSHVELNSSGASSYKSLAPYPMTSYKSLSNCSITGIVVRQNDGLGRSTTSENQGIQVDMDEHVEHVGEDEQRANRRVIRRYMLDENFNFQDEYNEYDNAPLWSRIPAERRVTSNVVYDDYREKYHYLNPVNIHRPAESRCSPSKYQQTLIDSRKHNKTVSVKQRNKRYQVDDYDRLNLPRPGGSGGRVISKIRALLMDKEKLFAEETESERALCRKVFSIWERELARTIRENEQRKKAERRLEAESNGQQYTPEDARKQETKPVFKPAGKCLYNPPLEDVKMARPAPAPRPTVKNLVKRMSSYSGFKTFQPKLVDSTLLRINMIQKGERTTGRHLDGLKDILRVKLSHKHVHVPVACPCADNFWNDASHTHQCLVHPTDRDYLDDIQQFLNKKWCSGLC